MIYCTALLFIQFINAQVPYSVEFEPSTGARPLQGGLSDNGIINIEILNSSTIFLGTSGGLNVANYDLDDNYQISHYSEVEQLPSGGNPALTIHDNIIAVSGLVSVDTSVGEESKGTGVSYSLNGGQTWNYIEQPKDNSNQTDPTYINKWSCPWGNNNILYSDRATCNEYCDDCFGNNKSCKMYNYITWGNQSLIRNLSVTTDIQNISYDLAIQGDYIYAASWAGSLRRFNYTIDEPFWEVVPLPMDDQNSLNCNQINLSSYQINPVGNHVQDGNDDCGYEFDNHKVFSVYSLEDTLWVGTANGINKGIVSSDDCINWTSMKSADYGFYDDWVIGFEHQILSDEITRIWAITWDREYTGSQLIYGGPPSYTDDGGSTWNIINYLDNKDVLTYNISTLLNTVYVSTNQGGFINTNIQNSDTWLDFLVPGEITQESVYDMEYISQYNDLWIGSSQGALVYNDGSFTINTSSSNVNSSFYAYPNPYILKDDNDITFVFDGEENKVNGTIEIYDYSMDKVVTISASGITRWNGKNEYRDKVANGIYICHYKHNGDRSYFFKVMVIKD